MAVFEIFSHPELRRYRTTVCSRASIILIFTLFLTFIPPLFIVYRSYGFWRKTDTYREYPEIHFKHELLMVAELAGEGNYVTYSTYQTYNTLQQARLRIPLITSREEDVNGDGRPDNLLFNLELPLDDTESQFSTLTMEGMVFINHDNPKPGARYDVVGELRFNQKEPLSHTGTDHRYNSSVIDSTSIYAEDFLLPTIFKNYVARNLTTYLNAPYTVWSTGRAAGQPFVLSASIAYPEELFHYTPGFWYLIKWGWVQYVSVLLLFLFVFDRIKIFIYSNQLVNTIVVKPWKQEIKGFPLVIANEE
ncbi:TM231-like protein [Mya arenaria]|uniref:Transmembrane protein 231 n=1 Tax=Mya arenaria TaxID=6604 RepID=A0ABY7EUJ7_MYAAR|nr:TM231-like protein [Mya arenaria]